MHVKCGPIRFINKNYYYKYDSILKHDQKKQMKMSKKNKNLIIKFYFQKLSILEYFYTLDKEYINKKELMNIINLRRRKRNYLKYWRNAFYKSLAS